MAQHFHQPSDPAPGSPSGRECPVCAKPTVWRCGRYGDFHGCQGYPACLGKIGRPRGPHTPRTPPPAPTPEAPPEVPSEVKGDEMPPPVPVTPGSLESALSIALRPMFDDVLRQAREAALEEVAKHPGSAPLEIKLDGRESVKIEHAHSSLPDLVKHVSYGFHNIFVCGPAGCGKTTLARDLAKALSLQFTGVSFSAGMTEARLEGRMVPVLHDGTEKYRTTESVRVYREGGVILWDEIDASDPNVLICVNAAVGNGHWFLPNGELVERHPDCIIICAANTYGTGADRMYVGRNQLDSATLDRFACAILDIDYDTALEERYLPNAVALSRIWEIRKRVRELRLRRLFGTRTVIGVAKLLKAGLSLDAALTHATAGWTPEEKSKVGV